MQSVRARRWASADESLGQLWIIIWITWNIHTYKVHVHTMYATSFSIRSLMGFLSTVHQSITSPLRADWMPYIVFCEAGSSAEQVPNELNRYDHFRWSIGTGKRRAGAAWIHNVMSQLRWLIEWSKRKWRAKKALKHVPIEAFRKHYSAWSNHGMPHRCFSLEWQAQTGD